MGGKIVSIFVLALLVFPFVSADIIISLLPLDPGVSMFLIIPVVLIESLFAYLIVKKMFKTKIKFLPVLGMLFLANVITTLIGWSLLFNDVYFLSAYRGSVNVESFLGIIGLFLLTSAIETPAIYLLIKKNSKESIKISIITSLIANFVSYLLLILFVVVGNVG